MLKTLARLNSKGLIHPPPFLLDNLMYLCQMGSVAYGISTEGSDVDIYGFCVPPKAQLFPHLAGNIHGFDQLNNFEQWQQHHIQDPDNDKEYDFSVFSIIKYFVLTMNNNPNMIDSLFVPRNCVLHSTQMSEYIRENRKRFLHKGSWFKFRGYAFSQMTKMLNKNPDPKSKRYELVQKHGYDTKFAVHLVRLLLEVEQILVEGDIDLQRGRKQLKAIREGEWSLDEIIGWSKDKEKELDTVYLRCTLPERPDRTFIKNLLIHCLEIHYGSLDQVILIQKTSSDEIIEKIKQLLSI